MHQVVCPASRHWNVCWGGLSRVPCGDNGTKGAGCQALTVSPGFLFVRWLCAGFGCAFCTLRELRVTGLLTLSHLGELSGLTHCCSSPDPEVARTTRQLHPGILTSSARLVALLRLLYFGASASSSSRSFPVCGGFNISIIILSTDCWGVFSWLCALSVWAASSFPSSASPFTAVTSKSTCFPS